MKRFDKTGGSLSRFLRANYKVIAGLLAGCVAGYLHWYHFGIQWGSYPLSSECWVNCVYGSLFGGFIVSLATEKRRMP